MVYLFIVIFAIIVLTLIWTPSIAAKVFSFLRLSKKMALEGKKEYKINGIASSTSYNLNRIVIDHTNSKNTQSKKVKPKGLSFLDDFEELAKKNN